MEVNNTRSVPTTDTNSPLNMNLPNGTKFQAPGKLDHSTDEPNSLGGNWKTSALGLSAVLIIHRNGKSQSAASKIIPACEVKGPNPRGGRKTSFHSARTAFGIQTAGLKPP